jgi:hypothetical protein
MHEQSKGLALTRRQVVTGLGAGAAGATIMPPRANPPHRPAEPGPRRLGPALPDLPIAVKYARVAASSFQPPDHTTPWQLAGGTLRTTAVARFTAPLAPATGDQLTELTLFIDPGGQTGSVQLTRESLTGPTDLLVGSYGPSSGATAVNLFVPNQPVFAQPDSDAYTVGIDLKPGVTFYGARITYFSATTSFVFMDPVRIWDSRTAQGALLIPGARAGGRKFTGTEFGFTVDTVIPRFSYGPLLNVTLDQTQGGGYVVVWGKGELDPAPPPTSNLNWYGPNQTVANLVITRMVGEADITVTLGGAGSTHIIIDLLGYFT